MANIRVDVDYTIIDGSEVLFRSPVDCSVITGLKIYYPSSNGAAVSKEFAFADAHGNNVGDIDHLFAEDVVVKVILDVTKSMAFVQNADTNAYLEGRFREKAPAGYGYGEIPVNLGSVTDDATFLVKLNEQFAKTVSRTRLVVFTRNGNAWLGELYNAGNDWGTLTAYCYGGDNSSQFSKLVRNRRDGVWSDWEYENPPLKNNTEYRTTERCDGKPVYVKRVDLGALPNKSNKREVIVPTGSTIVGIDGYSVYTSSAGNEIYTPLVKTDGVTSFFVNKTTGQVGINTDTDLSTYTATVTVKYTK